MFNSSGLVLDRTVGPVVNQLRAAGCGLGINCLVNLNPNGEDWRNESLAANKRRQAGVGGCRVVIGGNGPQREVGFRGWLRGFEDVPHAASALLLFRLLSIKACTQRRGEPFRVGCHGRQHPSHPGSTKWGASGIGTVHPRRRLGLPVAHYPRRRIHAFLRRRLATSCQC